MLAEDLNAFFMLPLCIQASEELEALQQQLHNTEYDQDAMDRWTPVWGNKYTSRQFYSYVYRPVEAHPIFKIVWKSRCVPRIKFFAWLILVDRLNTKTMLQRRHFNVQDGTACIMCTTGEQETIEHLFFECPFAQQCWTRLGISWDSTRPAADPAGGLGGLKPPLSSPNYIEITVVRASNHH